MKFNQVNIEFAVIDLSEVRYEDSKVLFTTSPVGDQTALVLLS